MGTLARIDKLLPTLRLNLGKLKKLHGQLLCDDNTKPHDTYAPCVYLTFILRMHSIIKSDHLWFRSLCSAFLRQSVVMFSTYARLLLVNYSLAVARQIDMERNRIYVDVACWSPTCLVNYIVQICIVCWVCVCVYLYLLFGAAIVGVASNIAYNERIFNSNNVFVGR